MNPLDKYKQVDLLTERKSLFDINLLDRKALAKKLGVSPSLISKLQAKEGLPYIKIAGATRYSITEVEAFFQSRRPK